MMKKTSRSRALLMKNNREEAMNKEYKHLPKTPEHKSEMRHIKKEMKMK